MPRYLGLPAALRARGLTVELVPGWETRGSDAFYPQGSISHWTAGNTTSDRGSLAICVNGKTGVPGPLCNVFLPRSRVVIVVGAGRANHGGVGGIGGLVGNSSTFGTEAENSGGGEWTAFQRWAYPRINAAYIDLGASPSHIYGHSEWAPTRKIDIRDWPMSRMRLEVIGLLAGRGGFMADLTESEQREILTFVREINPILRETYNKAAQGGSIAADARTGTQEIKTALAGQDKHIDTIEGDVSASRTMLAEQADTLADAVAAALNAAGAGVDTAVVRQAVRDEIGKLEISLPNGTA